MDKIWIVTPEQLAEIKAVVKTVYNRDFKGKSISTDDIADIVLFEKNLFPSAASR